MIGKDANVQIDGLFLNEVGNWSDILTEEIKKQMDLVIEQAFENAGASKHGKPRIFWSDNETGGSLPRRNQCRLSRQEG